MDEHVLGDGGGRGRVGRGLLEAGRQGGRDEDLESAHVSGIAGILQAILVALEEKLELIPEK